MNRNLKDLVEKCIHNPNMRKVNSYTLGVIDGICGTNIFYSFTQGNLKTLVYNSVILIGAHAAMAYSTHILFRKRPTEIALEKIIEDLEQQIETEGSK